MLLHQGQKVPLSVAAERRLAEIWIMGNVVVGIYIVIRKIATPAAGQQNFPPRLFGVIDNEHLAVTLAGFNCAHQP